MKSFQIVGGTPLFGSLRLGGAKNASFKLMIASLFADNESRLLNFSHISDVAMVARLITNLGGRAEEVGERAYVIDPRGMSSFEITASTSEVSRASTLFIPALVARFGKAIVPFPGGDKIGNRPLERHFQGLEKLGMHIEVKDGMIHVEAKELVATTYRFEKNTHTGTETLIMAALKAKGTTRLENCALETEIDDMIAFVNAMGAKVKRLPDRVIEIEGVEHMHGAVYKIMPDQNQAVSYACAALATKGDVIVEDANSDSLGAFLQKLDAIGAGYEVGKYGIRFYYKGPLQATDVTTAVHPGFKTDWGPLWVVMMTQAAGVSMLHETVYESRFAYVDSLTAMGANIELFNPPVANPEETYNFNLKDEKPGTMHAARITGPSALHGGEFTCKDLRHGATLMIAGMIASGTTILHDPESQIDRGYERFHEKLVKMGAKITMTE